LKSIIAFLLLSVLIGVEKPIESQPAQPDVNEVVRRIQRVYARNCCFRAVFDQMTVNVAMDLKDRFKGVMYVKKPGHIALDVEWPEVQKVVVTGTSYAVYFPEEGSAVRGEVPPEINVEHFFGFFANIGNLDSNFAIRFAARPTDQYEKLILLELTDPKNPRSTYRIVLGVDVDQFIIKRAIIYDALGNYNRFDLSNITFLSSLPDSVFKVAPGPTELIAPLVPRSSKDRENE
jgi:outer membrane lipoprotein-sorting protein